MKTKNFVIFVEVIRDACAWNEFSHTLGEREEGKVICYRLDDFKRRQ